MATRWAGISAWLTIMPLPDLLTGVAVAVFPLLDCLPSLMLREWNTEWSCGLSRTLRCPTQGLRLCVQTREWCGG